MSVPFRLWLLVLAGIVWPVTDARAQGWAFDSYDDGSFFSAHIAPVGGPGFSLICGERSPRGLSPAQTGNTEPEITPRDTLRLYFDPQDFPLPGQPLATQRSDMMIVIGSRGYGLPPVRLNELTGLWETDLLATDAVFAAIAAAPVVELRSSAGVTPLTTAGFGQAHARLLSHCQSMFTAIGLPWSVVPPPTMRQAARLSATAGCGGPADIGPEAILTGEIDGDGQPDVVLDWRAVTCRNGPRHPFCGAAMCSASVFLSSRHATTGSPEEFLALGVRLQPLSNGRMAVAVGGSLADCSQTTGQAPCEFLYWWNGAAMVRLR